jgi:glycosyltransferase involved in cell wall biosynthesis
VVSASALTLSPDNRVRNVVETNRNPATRRNRAASEARGEILAFIDDDAEAADGWLETACKYLDEHADVLALGGPDPAPADSTVRELIADTLLRTPYAGSGVAAHETRPGIFQLSSPSDLALVNLFIRKSAFTGFDESIGYIGEDTALLEGLMERGRIVYHEGVRVFHRRRSFPGPYLRQRWRYRVKSGMLFISGARANRKKVTAFLIAGTLAILFAPLAFVPYAVAMLILGARSTRLPAVFWPVLPFAFAAHHLTYYFGILWGIFRGLTGGSRHANTQS